MTSYQIRYLVSILVVVGLLMLLEGFWWRYLPPWGMRPSLFDFSVPFSERVKWFLIEVALQYAPSGLLGYLAGLVAERIVDACKRPPKKKDGCPPEAGEGARHG